MGTNSYVITNINEASFINFSSYCSILMDVKISTNPTQATDYNPILM